MLDITYSFDAARHYYVISLVDWVYGINGLPNRCLLTSTFIVSEYQLTVNDSSLPQQFITITNSLIKHWNQENPSRRIIWDNDNQRWIISEFYNYIDVDVLDIGEIE